MVPPGEVRAAVVSCLASYLTMGQRRGADTKMRAGTAQYPMNKSFLVMPICRQGEGKGQDFRRHFDVDGCVNESAGVVAAFAVFVCLFVCLHGGLILFYLEDDVHELEVEGGDVNHHIEDGDDRACVLGQEV